LAGFTLLAMASSGDTYLARDPAGLIWLFQPLGAGEPRVVELDAVERAVAFHGFDPIDREFPTWADLDDFVEEQAARTAPDATIDRQSMDLADVERLLAVVAAWAEEGAGDQAMGAALALLEVPAVLDDPATHRRIVGFLRSLGRPRSRFASAPHTDAQRTARDRWGELAA